MAKFDMNSMLGMTPEEMEIARKQRYAERLRTQADEPMQGQVVGGMYIPPSWTQGLAKMLSSYSAGRTEREANDEYTNLQNQRKTDFMDTAQKYAAALKGTPADTMYDPELGQNIEALPAQPGSREAALGVALQSNHPMWQQAGMQGMLNPAEAEKPQLVTVYENGKPIQKWLRPGETQGATIGMGKPESNMSTIGLLMAERDQLPPNDPRRQLYDQAIQKATTHQPGVQVSYGAPVAGVDPQGNPVFFQPSKEGGKPAIIPGVAPTPPVPKEPTGEERTAAGFLGRMQAAEKLINEAAGGEATEGTAIAGAVPFVGDYLQRKVMNETQQKYKQAADDWIRAKLRKESGAVIGDEEMKREYQTYFPQPGDSAAVIAQKAAARKQAEEQMKIGAGRAYQGGTLSREEILNEELKQAIAKGDTQNADLIRKEMKAMGFKQPATQKVKRYNPQTGRIE